MGNFLSLFQVQSEPKKVGEFVNTWSVEGMIAEGGHQPSEMGWGTHEKHFPSDGSHFPVGPKCSIFLNQPGKKIRNFV